MALAALTMAPRPAGARIAFDAFALPVGDNPQALAASDCDGDGVQDLVVANLGSATVTILRNDGAGSFTHLRTFATIPQPAGAVCADLDGDGIPDAAVSSFSDGTVAIYRGEPSGTMTPLGSHAVGLQPRSIAASDFDDDGAVDLLVVNARSSGLSVLLGDGAGGFPYGATLRLPATMGRNAPVAATVADFDGNGLADIAVVSQGHPPLRLLLGDGLGFRFTAETLPFPPNPRGTAAADLDADGTTDLAVLSTDSTIRLYPGLAGGRFASGHVLVVPPDARGIALADLDGDGLPDLATSHGKSNSVEVLRASGPGRFPAAAHGPSSSSTINPSGALAVRPTSTGEEVLAADGTARALTLLTAPDATALAAETLFSLSGTPRQLLLADMNGDGVADAIVAFADRKRPLQVLLGNGSGGYDAPMTNAAACGNGVVEAPELCDDGNASAGDGCGRACMPEVGGGVLAMQAADLDGDGARDLVLTDQRGAVRAHVGNGRGAFRELRVHGRARPRTAAVVAPFTGDGPPDVAYVPRKPKAPLMLLVNDGAGGFAARALPVDPTLAGPFVAADLDRNGFVALVTQRKGGGLVVLYNDGDGPARPAPVVALPTALRALAAADFDEDGWVDLLASFKGTTSPPRILRGSAGGLASGSASVLDAGLPVIAVADLNEDLHQDLVACTESSAGSCVVRYGDGAGGFQKTPPLTASSATGAYIGRQTRGAAAIDLDGDGHVDLVGASRRDNRVVVLYASSDPTAVERLELVAGTKPTAVGVGDLDGDGRPDVVATNEGSNDVSVFLNRGRGRFASLARLALPATTLGAGGLALGDLDGDGRLDLVVALAAGSGVVPYLNRGGGGLVSAGILPTGLHPQAVALGDLDGDGRLDIVTADLDEDALSVLRSRDGYASTTLPSGGTRPTDVAIADVNGDGAPDLVAVHDGSRTLVTFLNDGMGAFADHVVTSLPGRRRPWDLCVGDFDGDATPDIAVGSFGTTDILVSFGAGDGTWRPDMRLFPIGQDPRPLFCADLDRDGRSDVLFTRRRSGRLDAIVTGGI